ncbi:hypothetical protein [Peribacillus frigoritolerans]|uniref:hypothetical protein n=1 Tax=Peribacillus frigoritolerans TaxID=450367 RepID=UPI0021AA834E|nr:hypothetical protein [Peribacillus frigoritolerans]
MRKTAPARNPAGMINRKKFQKDIDPKDIRKFFKSSRRLGQNKKGIIKGKFRLWNFT